MGRIKTRRAWIIATTAAVSGVLGVKSASAQSQQNGLKPVIPDPTNSEEVRLPNGKKQSDEILKVEFQKTLEEARELTAKTRSLQEDLEKEDRFVLSLATLKKLDDIEKLTKRIRARLKH